MIAPPLVPPVPQRGTGHNCDVSRKEKTQTFSSICSGNTTSSQCGGCPRGGSGAPKSVRIVQMISYENQILSDKIMGVETPIPPIIICAAAPGRKPPRRINDRSLKNHRTAPPCPGGALRRGALVKIMISFPISMVPVNPRRSCTILQSFLFPISRSPGYIRKNPCPVRAGERPYPSHPGMASAR